TQLESLRFDPFAVALHQVLLFDRQPVMRRADLLVRYEVLMYERTKNPAAVVDLQGNSRAWFQFFCVVNLAGLSQNDVFRCGTLAVDPDRNSVLQAEIFWVIRQQQCIDGVDGCPSGTPMVCLLAVKNPLADLVQFTRIMRFVGFDQITM